MVVATVAGVLTVAIGAVALTLGDYELPLAGVLRTLAGHGTLITYDVVVNNRLPRVLVGIGVGTAFAVSGAIFQRLARNPLVSPDLIGINAGAALAAVLMITVLGSGWIPGGALLGSLLAAITVYALAYRNGVSGHRLVLVGIGVTAIIGALTAYLLTLADIYTAQSASMWLAGSLAGRSWMHVVLVGGALAVGLPAAAGLTRQLRLLELGDDLARALGGRVELARGVLIALGVGLAALATAAAGPVGFVALVAPQLARRLVPRRLGLLVPGAIGALLVVASDLVARTVVAPTVLPVGIVTAFLGAPYLLFLLTRARI